MQAHTKRRFNMRSYVAGSQLAFHLVLLILIGVTCALTLKEVERPAAPVHVAVRTADGAAADRRGLVVAEGEAKEHVSVKSSSSSPSTPPVAAHPLVRIMPLGDSISICCNYCAVPAGVLMRKDLAEPPTPWDGYIRKLWHLLHAHSLNTNADDDSQNHSFSSSRSTDKIRSFPSRCAANDTDADATLLRCPFTFEYVGRVQTCMVNRSATMRVADDWHIRYEGYYGYTTGRILAEVVNPALAANDPDVVLLMLGTNDLIQPKAKSRLSRVGHAVENLKALISTILTTPRHDAEKEDDSRHVYIAKIPPIWFHQIKAVPPSARKPHRVVMLNSEIEKMVAQLVAQQKERFVRLGGHASRFIPTVHLVDMFRNVSAQDDLHGDGLHPNDSGEAKIAARWFAAIRPLLHAPARYLDVSSAQNDQRLFEQHLSAVHGGQRNGFSSNSSSTKNGLANTHVGKLTSSDEELQLFGEHPTSVAVDAALLPVVLITVLLYVFAVCRPTNRWARHTYTRISLWFPGQKPARPSPQ